MTHGTAWRDLSGNDLGFLNILSGIFVSLETRHPNALPNLRAADCLFVGSDYGGEHRGPCISPLRSCWQTLPNVQLGKAHVRSSAAIDF
jgi:hypothetical protein